MDISIDLVHNLVAAQFPKWANLPIKPVDFSGWDNRTFRLGERMSVRLPSAEGYAAQVEKEQRWLPRLAPLLPLPIPVPLAMGSPGNGYPWHWSIYRWLDGEPATMARIDDLSQFATRLAEFLADLQRIDTAGGPMPGPHNNYRGGSLTVYDGETHEAVAALGDEMDVGAVMAVWQAALAARWSGESVWLHGDVSAGNLLVRNGELSAVIDFGSCGIGDPACDLAIAWTFFAGDSREAFRHAMPADAGMWARGRGWALWKALKTVVEYRSTEPAIADRSRLLIREVLAEHEHA